MLDGCIFTVIIVVCLFVFLVIAHTVVYAQEASQRSAPARSMSLTSQHQASALSKPHGVKITSPTKGDKVAVGKDLTISGTSMDNATSNDCKVFIRVNKINPYQPSTGTATGLGGGVDYSKWNFVLTSKYTTIKPGENRITAKYECASNPDANTFSSINVTGVSSGTMINTASATKGDTAGTEPVTTATSTAKVDPVNKASSEVSPKSIIAPQVSTTNQPSSSSINVREVPENISSTSRNLDTNNYTTTGSGITNNIKSQDNLLATHTDDPQPIENGYSGNLLYLGDVKASDNNNNNNNNPKPTNHGTSSKDAKTHDTDDNPETHITKQDSSKGLELSKSKTSVKDKPKAEVGRKRSTFDPFDFPIYH
jgi:hypothetical protein